MLVVSLAGWLAAAALTVDDISGRLRRNLRPGGGAASAAAAGESSAVVVRCRRRRRAAGGVAVASVVTLPAAGDAGAPACTGIAGDEEQQLQLTWRSLLQVCLRSVSQVYAV